MIADRDNKKLDTLDEALTRFVDAYVRGEQPDIDEFVERYPQLEGQIRQRVQSLCEIDALFDSIVQTNASDFEEGADRDLVGKRIGNFEITEMIGRGGMGVVYLANDTKLKRSVAIKSMPAKLAADPMAKTRFRREAELLASLNHPHISVIHDIIEDEADTGYLVLEYVSGETLTERIAREPLSVEQALSFGGQIAEAISAAHEKGVVHRDLKPGNIKITPEGKVKVLDFGLAKTSGGEDKGSETTATQPGRIMGTPAYMSPEQARGLPTDHRTDIWSFGCILYQMLTGHLPFEGETATDILALIIEREPDWKLLPDETPENMHTLLQHCMEKDQDKRLDNIADAIMQISDTMSRPLTAPVPTALPRLKRAVMIFAAIFIVALVAMGVWFTFYQPVQPPSRNPRLVVLPFDNLGSAEQELFTNSMTDEISTRLGFVDRLDVIWPRSASEFKKMGISTQIAKKFNLDYVLEGQFQYYRPSDPNSRVRIRIRLINAADLTQVWQETYDRSTRDIFTLQTDVAEKVARALDMTLREPEPKATPYGYRENSEAYACVYQARQYFLGSDSREGNLEAIKLYEKAIELEPNYAEAHALLSWALTNMYWFHGKNPEFLPGAMEEAQRALELVPDMPYAHIALGRYYYQGYLDYENALEQFTIILRRFPNYRWAIKWTAMVQERMGHFDEALENLFRAAELDPLNPEYVRRIADTLLFQRKYEDAERYYEQAIKMAPDRRHPYYGKACLYLLWQGNTQKARKVIEDGLLHSKELSSNMGIFETLIKIDLYDREYEEALNKLKEKSNDIVHNAVFIPNSLWQAEIYGYMGDKELEKHCYELAVAVLEDKITENQRDDRYHSSLGKAYAGLGRKQEAIKHGRLAVEYLPVDKDALIGPLRLRDLAHIYVTVGEYDAAIDIVEDLLNSNDCHLPLTRPKLRRDPVWDPLRDHPRFQQLLSAHR